MNPESLSFARRTLLGGAAAAAAALSMRQAIAQTSSDWLSLVKAHHALVAATFEQMLDSTDKTFLRRENLQALLHYQLTAHSVAEENVLYPALARSGAVSDADKLYLDQAHAKVMDAEIALMSVQDQAAWLGKVRLLQAAVLKHAKEDEEGRLYPALLSKLDARTNQVLTARYRAEFASVSAARPGA